MDAAQFIIKYVTDVLSYTDPLNYILLSVHTETWKAKFKNFLWFLIISTELNAY